MTDDIRIARRLRIVGRVQGVGYRQWMVWQARALGIDGWVRNRTDRSVEALIAGPSSSIDAMLTKCRQGPDLAHVRELQSEGAEDPGTIGFSEEATR